MTIIGLLLILALLAGAYWLFIYKLATPVPLKWIIGTVIIVIAVWLCLDAFGILDEIRNKRVPKI